MKDLFCIDFDFLGVPIKIFVKTWINRDEVYQKLNTYPTTGRAMFGASVDENDKPFSYILFNDKVLKT